MNGPEHYREAERLLELDMTARAQVHATLALTAATAANIRRNGALANTGTKIDESYKVEDIASGWLEVLWT